MGDGIKELTDMLQNDKKELSELIDKIKTTITKGDKVDQAAIMAVGEVLSSLYRSKIDINDQLIRLFLSDKDSNIDEDFSKISADYDKINSEYDYNSENLYDEDLTK